MIAASRRNLLAMVALAVPYVRSLVSVPASASSAADTYPSNTVLYADPNLAEGVDYACRYQRHRWFDDSLSQRFGFAKTTALAPHGGGIEVGTSELCLAVAGLELTTPLRMAMFEVNTRAQRKNTTTPATRFSDSPCRRHHTRT
jgi:phage replication-related protein YjqB (UPF0714/DUF867 family)